MKRNQLTQHQQSTEHNLIVPSHYIHAGEGGKKPLLVLLHGYSDTAASFLRRALPVFPPRYEILAPNGPFPVPQWLEGEWKDAFSWYFANLSEKRITVAPVVAARAIALLVERLGLSEREKVLCGFSQGGYFLPHLAKELKNVKRMIALGSGFHPEFFAEFGLSLPVDAIHGEEDEVIPLKEAQGDYAGLGSWNLGGALRVIPGMSHTINEEGRAALAELLV